MTRAEAARLRYLIARYAAYVLEASRDPEPYDMQTLGREAWLEAMDIIEENTDK